MTREQIPTGWKRLLNKNVLSQNYFLSISGGTEKVRYATSAGYLSKDGIIQNTGYQRYSFRLNTDYSLGKYVRAGENLGVTSAKRRGNDYSASWGNAFTADPVTPVLKPPGSVDVNDPDYKYNKYAPTIDGGNPVLAGELNNLENDNLTLVGNMFAEITILKDLKFRSNWGFNLAFRDESDFQSGVLFISCFSKPG